MRDQAGEVFKPKGQGRTWCMRYYARPGERRQVGGFRTKSEARAALQLALDDVRGYQGPRSKSVDEMLDRFEASLSAGESRRVVIRWALAQFRQEFGDRSPRMIRGDELGAWRESLPEARRFQVFAIVKQAFRAAEQWGEVRPNPAASIRNPQGHRAEIRPFESWTELARLDVELGTPIASFAGGTGLRPEEWIALDAGDIRLSERVVIVSKKYVDGKLTPFGGKTKKSIRRVPLRQRVIDALPGLEERSPTEILFPGVRGGRLNLRMWRQREWKPAIEAAGLAERGPYALRHTYATWSLAAGVNAFQLARRMGTSVEIIDKHYAHLIPNADEYEVALLDQYDGKRNA